MKTTASQDLHSLEPDKREKVIQSFVEISTDAEYFAVIISLEWKGSLPSANRFLTLTCKCNDIKCVLKLKLKYSI